MYDLRQIGMRIPVVGGFVRPVVERIAGVSEAEASKGSIAGWMEDSGEGKDGNGEEVVSVSAAKVGSDVEEDIDAGNDNSSVEGEIISPSILAMSASSTSSGSTYTPARTPHEFLLDVFDEFEDLPWHLHAHWDPPRVPAAQPQDNWAADLFFLLLRQLLKLALLLLLPFVVAAMAAAQFALWLGAGWVWWDDVATNVDGYGYRYRYGGIGSEEEERVREEREWGWERLGGLN